MGNPYIHHRSAVEVGPPQKRLDRNEKTNRTHAQKVVINLRHLPRRRGRWKRNHGSITIRMTIVGGSQYERIVRNQQPARFHAQVEVVQAGARSHGPSETELHGRFSIFGVRNEWVPGLHTKIYERGGVPRAERDRKGGRSHFVWLDVGCVSKKGKGGTSPPSPNPPCCFL